LMKYRLLVLVFVLTGIFTVPVQAQSRSLFWDVWAVDISDFDMVNNAFTVREIYSVTFTGRFYAGNRFIENTNLDRIENVQVYQNGVAFTPSCSSAEPTSSFCVRNVSDGVSIDYIFSAPINSGRAEFVIEYRVVGAMRVYEGGNQLWWTAIPYDTYGFSVGSSTIRVNLPHEFAPREGIDPVVTYGAPANVDVKGATITAQATQRISGNETFEIRVQFPHSENLHKPTWQSEFDSRRDFEENVQPLIDLAALAFSLLVSIGGPLGVYALWYTRGRDPKVGPVPKFLSEPPSDLPPAIVGTLVDEKADTRDVISTLIDLARRGYLVIEEERPKLIFGMTGSSKFTFKRTDLSAEGLRKYERDMLNYIFGKKLERSMDSLNHKFYTYMPNLQSELYKEIVTEGLFPDNPNNTRAVYSGIGVAILAVAGIAFFFAVGALEELTPTLMCLPIAIGLGGLAMLIVGQHMPHKTRKGAEEAAKWMAFREYLENLDRYAKVDGVPEQFDAYLPYAVAFGIDRSWIRRFAKVSNAPAPVWYYPTYRGGRYGGGYKAGTPLPTGGGLPSSRDVLPGDMARAGSGGLESMSQGISGGLESMSQGLSRMLESASRTMTSTPPSASSGSSGSWSGGGGSFSGGGSFGGGSSGGGSSGFR
jgi:uncharacterized membrane protein